MEAIGKHPVLFFVLCTALKIPQRGDGHGDASLIALASIDGQLATKIENEVSATKLSNFP